LAKQCVVVCCSVLQCVVVCCSVLQCVAVCCSVLQCVTACCSVLQRVASAWPPHARSLIVRALPHRCSRAPTHTHKNLFHPRLKASPTLVTTFFFFDSPSVLSPPPSVCCCICTRDNPRPPPVLAIVECLYGQVRLYWHA